MEFHSINHVLNGNFKFSLVHQDKEDSYESDQAMVILCEKLEQLEQAPQANESFIIKLVPHKIPGRHRDECFRLRNEF